MYNVTEDRKAIFSYDNPNFTYNQLNIQLEYNDRAVHLAKNNKYYSLYTQFLRINWNWYNYIYSKKLK